MERTFGTHNQVCYLSSMEYLPVTENCVCAYWLKRTNKYYIFLEFDVPSLALNTELDSSKIKGHGLQLSLRILARKISDVIIGQFLL